MIKVTDAPMISPVRLTKSSGLVAGFAAMTREAAEAQGEMSDGGSGLYDVKAE